MVSTWFHHQDPPPLAFGVWTLGRRFNGASGRRVCVCVQQDSVSVDGGLYRKLRAHFVIIAFHCRCSSSDKWSRKVFCLLPALTSLYNPLSIASLLHCFIASLLHCFVYFQVKQALVFFWNMLKTYCIGLEISTSPSNFKPKLLSLSSIYYRNIIE